MAKTTKQIGNAFEDEVAKLLVLRGYSIERDKLVSGTQIDFLALKDDPLENIALIVECTDRSEPIGVPVVKEKASILLALKHATEHLYRVMIVTRIGFTKEAREFAASQPGLLLMTEAELERQLIDFQPYVDWYLQGYEASTGIFAEGKLYHHYVDLSATDESNVLIPSVTQELESWMHQDKNNLVILLGQYGSGKTSLVRQFVYKLLAERARAANHTHYLPILINLRDCRSVFRIQQVVTDTLVNLYGVNIHSFRAFERFCSSGRVLLVLDGLDEMIDRSDRQYLLSCFSQIYVLANLNAKVIVTCRSSFFRSNSDVLELLRHFSISVPIEGKKEVRIEIGLRHQGRIYDLQKWDEQQIVQYIRNRCGDEADSILQSIHTIHDLGDLSTRPVLLDMIVTTIPELKNAKGKITSSRLYLHYTDKWTERDDWRTNLPSDLRKRFCQSLAWVTHCFDIDEIEASLLRRAIMEVLGPLSKDSNQLEVFQNDIQTCSFLVKGIQDGTFRFAHKSFREFFVACKIVEDILQGETPKKANRQDWLGEPEGNPRATFSGEAVNEWIASALHSGDVASASPYYKLTIDDPDSRGVVIRLLDTYFVDMLGTEIDSSILTFSERRSGRSSFVGSFSNLISLSTEAGPKSELAFSLQQANTEQTIRKHLDESFLAEFSQRIDENVLELGISEEIATFAVELLDLSGLSLEKIIAKASKEQPANLLCGILRLAKPTEFIRRNYEVIKNTIRKTKSELLKVSLCIAIGRIDDRVDMSLVTFAREQLKPQSWSLFYFGLTQGKIEEIIYRQVLEFSDLRPIDRLSTYYGLRKVLSKEELTELCYPSLLELLTHPSGEGTSFGLDYLSCLELSDRQVVSIISAVLKAANGRDVSPEILEVLGTLREKGIWKAVRALWTRESNARNKAALELAEKAIRDNESRASNVKAKSQSSMERRIRDKMWMMLRSKR